MLRTYIVTAGALQVSLLATGECDAICRAMALGVHASTARRAA
ncbi:hypothetical protein [Acidovorax sp. Leaf160]|nr:hypothetical protein [Acidovorax sp. Leaf160]